MSEAVTQPKIECACCFRPFTADEQGWAVDPKFLRHFVCPACVEVIRGPSADEASQPLWGAP